jgi:ArsR family transcriptional regulator, arsenate/arsenite/antimonite-responsive transcriptional repressor
MHEDQAANGLSALGNRTRLRLFRLLVKAGDAGLNVGDIQARIDVPASTLAHHLTALARSGLVIQERRGRETLSRVDYARMRDLTNYLTDECCTGIDAPGNADAA